MDFGPQLGTHMGVLKRWAFEACLALGALLAPRWPQDGPKRPQEAPRGPKTASKTHFGAILEAFWKHFGAILEPFGALLVTQPYIHRPGGGLAEGCWITDDDDHADDNDY